MGDEANIRLVDSHPEGNGGHHHQTVFHDEPPMVPHPGFSIHPSVVRQGRHAFLVQKSSHLFDPLAAHGIDDAGLAGMFPLDEVQYLALRVVLYPHAIADVGPVEAGHEQPRLIETELTDDVGSRDLVRRCGQGNARNRRKPVGQLGKLAVIRAEVVTPLADAMGLVDGEECNFHPIELVEEALAEQSLRRHIEQVELASLDGAPRPARFVTTEIRCKCDGADAGLLQLRDLIFHQRDQGRDHHTHTRPTERRHLVADRLAAAGRHENQGVTRRR